ncbi:beta-1,3-glucan-binding protein-like [Toxorhynchites rutilus septentrionalis]|uniref:beta-1,3-glucan-binding protein-like n=1 Tax=Toxorhynchites rutilus septentrionalis TaxID=329112 RepID=UPI002479FC7F|nr:beta-1,3-glucan-binding protein-like [Toxorhynchites rutilus septentrionalis]XP_055625116.1 beta-1,3-glucan-binding protein-like [Toxorhynchites rutilus septentrionalis]
MGKFSFVLLIIGTLLLAAKAQRNRCNSPTTASGWKAPKGPYCKDQLIFEDNFKKLDRTVWEHENTVGGGGNNEFQWYSGNSRNSYVKDGRFYIKPTLTADEFGEEFLSSGVINLNRGPKDQRCTDAPGWAEQINGCQRTGSAANILNPIRSARVRTVNSFAFKYGKVEIKAKLPSGDWIWPALWMLPKGDPYGTWPKSGEIDIMESRGNQHLTQNNENIGAKKISSCLHFGPSSDYRNSECGSSTGSTFTSGFNRYQLNWTPKIIQFGLNDKIFRTVTPYEGFWKLGGFNYNPWPQGSKMAPFDREFFLIMNVAVGGNFFPDNAVNPQRKPWRQNSASPMTEFYRAKNQWFSTWGRGDDSALQVDYVKVWAA